MQCIPQTLVDCRNLVPRHPLFYVWCHFILCLKSFHCKQRMTWHQTEVWCHVIPCFQSGVMSSLLSIWCQVILYFQSSVKSSSAVWCHVILCCQSGAKSSSVFK